VTLTSRDLAAVARARADLASGRAKSARKTADIGLGEIAEALGVSHQAVSLWERGLRTPRAEHALAYGRLLGQLTRAAA
jgi:transcriptional regulator with XRE-family HTH domain